MKEINLGRILVENRHKRGITQDELAAYMGVSKAAVSKWETGMTYPDITLLPQLATYFNISIDELIGYEPQMTKEQIRVLCRKLATDFSTLADRKGSGAMPGNYEKVFLLFSSFVSDWELVCKL